MAPLVAPLDYGMLGNSENWFSFRDVSGVSIIGAGAFDAKGHSLWACKASNNNSCPSGATTLHFTNSNNIKIHGILSLNSQKIHIVINECQNVQIQGVKIIAAGDSPNTDGIHVQLSTNVEILTAPLKPVTTASRSAKAQRIYGSNKSLAVPVMASARELNEEGVQNVTVKKTTFTCTQNGLRIKSWAKPSTGFVEGVRYIDSLMRNVENPILIDQNYCPHNENCPNQGSGIKINDIVYEDIRGTSSTPIAIKFDCSTKNPCTGIKLQNVNLKYLNKAAQSICSNVVGKAFDLVQPNDCSEIMS
ncbi:Polygalacturonase [Hibiscus syriacus]|uniref:Polygalacturonase n=1 Tax=Hibiscus syriacus TaxID=106335 RepID=A0A6A3BSJ1_HIBSY|nr:Polygalacturonase [Hibiscus syriacus]